MALASAPAPFPLTDQEDTHFFDQLASNLGDTLLSHPFSPVPTGDPEPSVTFSSISQADDGSRFHVAPCDSADLASDVHLQDDELHEFRMRNSYASGQENTSVSTTTKHVDAGFGAAPQEPDIRELQWSSLFSPKEEIDSLSEFLKDVNLTAETPENNVALVASLNIETGPADAGFHSAVEQDNRDRGAAINQEHQHQVDLTDTESCGNISSDTQHDQSLVANYHSYENSASSQNLNTVYPGWFFDFASNQWKQIEGWDQNIALTNQTAQTTSENDHEHDVANTLDTKHQRVSGDATSSNNISSNKQYDQQNLAASNVSFENHASQQTWNSIYPGWFFDFASNQWKQIEGWDQNAALNNQTAQTTSENYYEHAAVSKLENEHQRNSGDATSSSNVSINKQYDQNLAASNVSFENHASQQTWDSIYPGWFFDFASNQWKQIEDWDQNAVLQNQTAQTASQNSIISNDKGSFILSSQETEGLTGTVELQHESQRQIGLQQSSESMYPGWYFDYVTNEWKSKEEENIQSRPVAVEHQISGSKSYHSNSSLSFMPNPVSYQILENKTHVESLTSQNDQVQVSSNRMDPITMMDEYTREVFEGNRINGNGIMSEKTSFDTWEMPVVSSSYSINSNVAMQEGLEYQSDKSVFGIHSENNVSFYNQYQSQPASVSQHNTFSAYGHHNVFQTATEISKSSSGCPPHPLVTFGFGGKLVTMKATSSGTCDPITFHDLNKLVHGADGLGKNDGVSYFATLNRGGLTGPLIDGGMTTKELLKWIDDRSSNCLSEDPQCTNSDALSILWKVLRIACIYYGKLRSMHNFSGTSSSQLEDGPEVAFGKLVSTLKSRNHHACFDASQITLSEDQLQLIISEMERNLISGKRKEALELAKQGQLWGPALILALQQGEKTYLDTIMEMSQQQFLPGCPLRTLFLTYSGNTTELFSSSIATVSNSDVKSNSRGMLDDWLARLSIIAANPTKGDEQIIMHLGDSLWKVQGEVAAAHTCYLVADANFEPFSENARLCLIGADHFRCQRTFATPLAIQRTEIYEYAKFLGNPQFSLQSFQPYKLLYAHMLVEAGKGLEARRYCQAIVKHLKHVSHNLQLQLCRQSALSLEERITMHFQRGYALSLATGNIVGSIFGKIDTAFHKIIGGFPSRLASEPTLNKNTKEWFSNGQRPDSKASGTSSVSAVPEKVSSNMNSQQTEVPTRSISEPNFSLGPQKEKTQIVSDRDSKGSTSESVNNGYFGRLFSIAVGHMKPNKREAKLGVKNKFYYNEELKRWVEEGSEQSMDDVIPPPPPTMTSSIDASLNSGLVGQMSSLSTTVPHLSTSMNQFSSRSRIHGVHSRYVDTFNQSTGKLAKSVDSTIVPKAGWGPVPTTQFFMPTTQSNIREESEDSLVTNSTLSFTTASSAESTNKNTNKMLNAGNTGQGFIGSMLSPLQTEPSLAQMGASNIHLQDKAGSYLSTDLQEVEL